ncbi:MAG: DPP IV N-terminal domain-containing protein, partial [Candidatus Aminicenantes bacterium]|nr:DPP IV N-terminal domain-containing protein [Candidatus Aminicenantes bacterium]
MLLRNKLALLTFVFFLLTACSGNEETGEQSVNNQALKPKIPFKGKIVIQSNMDGDNEIYLLTKDKMQKLTDNTWEDEYPVWSPDGKKIAFTANPRGNYDIFIMNPDGTDITPLTNSSSNEGEPSWFPDGKHIAYAREIKKLLRKEAALFKVNLDTKNTKRIIPGYSKINAIPHISPTAPLIVFTGKRTFGWDVAVYDMRKNEVEYLEEGGNSCRARFSPDGKKLAYVSSKADGKGDIWLMDPDGGEKTRLTESDETFDYFP